MPTTPASRPARATPFEPPDTAAAGGWAGCAVVAARGSAAGIGADADAGAGASAALSGVDSTVAATDFALVFRVPSAEGERTGVWGSSAIMPPIESCWFGKGQVRSCGTTGSSQDERDRKSTRLKSSQ